MLAFIIIAGEISYLTGIKNKSNSEVALLNQNFELELIEQIEQFADKQTSGHKLVSLSKTFGEQLPAKAHQILILRAQKLEPNDRDITVLASYFDPMLEAKIYELDPLYKK